MQGRIHLINKFNRCIDVPPGCLSLGGGRAKWKGDMAASWRDVFERRFTLDKNWGGQPHLRSLNAHHTLLRALQVRPLSPRATNARLRDI
jgi:hypothetical protein